MFWLFSNTFTVDDEFTLLVLKYLITPKINEIFNSFFKETYGRVQKRIKTFRRLQFDRHQNFYSIQSLSVTLSIKTLLYFKFSFQYSTVGAKICRRMQSVGWSLYLSNLSWSEENSWYYNLTVCTSCSTGNLDCLRVVNYRKIEQKLLPVLYYF